MLCPSCQTDLPLDAHFCPSCGHNLLETHQAYLDGLRAFCEGNYDDSLRKLKVALLTDPSNPEIIKDCGHAFLHNGDLSAALEMYQKADLLGGEFVDADYNRAVALLRSHHWSEAADIFRRIVSLSDIPVRQGIFYLGLLFPSRERFLAECFLHLGLCQRERGLFEEAQRCFHQALEFNPGAVSAHRHLGDLTLRAKHYQDAIAHYENVLSMSSMGDELIQTHNNLAVAYYENGQIDEAIRHFNWVLQHDPGNPSAIHNLNHIYEQEGIIREEPGAQRAVRFMDGTEGASPIFSLVQESREEAPEQEEAGRLSIVGRSQEMVRMMRHARLAAASDSTVFITGENGTGKELVARLIYMNSQRSEKPFVVVNSAAIPEALLESDLFGHEKGAFTGAVTRKPGRLELAHGGTVFFDEIGDLSPTLQVKLLRVLQEREFTRVGGTETIHVDIRIIAATNRDLPTLIAEGVFREDLYYRLNVIPIHLPPLRQRKEDIPILVDHFIRKYAKRNPKARIQLGEEELQTFMDYGWPGNVRELENMIERAVVMGAQPGLYLEELSRLRRIAQMERIQEGGGAERRETASPRERPPIDTSYEPELSLAEVERRHILRVLEHTGGNQRNASRLLGINPTTLWRKLKTYNIEPSEISQKQ